MDELESYMPKAVRSLSLPFILHTLSKLNERSYVPRIHYMLQQNFHKSSGGAKYYSGISTPSSNIVPPKGTRWNFHS